MAKTIRKNGSVCNENYHQMMKNAIGRWSIGAETSNNIILLLTFCYNINIGIFVCGEHNFGHLWIDLIDCVQNRVQDLFNVLIYPRHRNISYFTPIPEFAPVGIRPVTLLPDYVYIGEPADYLKGDLLFLAKNE